MIRKAEDQLANTEECIRWYEREREKNRRELEELLALRQFSESAADTLAAIDNSQPDS